MQLVDPAAHHDTPITRATINRLAVEELDTLLDGIRERRLTRVKKLEAIAKVKSDEAQLTLYIKYEKAVANARRVLATMKENEDKAEVAVNKVRALVMEME